MRQILWGIPVLVGCTLISDADQFVGDAGTGEVDVVEVDGGPSDAGPIDAGTDAGPSDAGTDGGPSDVGTDAGPSDAGTDAGPSDTGPFTDGSCAAQVAETSDDRWEVGRCCFSDSHCAGLTVGAVTDDQGYCLPDSCGAGGRPSQCLPSIEALRMTYGADSCYRNFDCIFPELCLLGKNQEYTELSGAVCGDRVPNPGICAEME